MHCNIYSSGVLSQKPRKLSLLGKLLKTYDEL